MEELVKKLIEQKLEIATVESCTGGALASEITSIEGASEILKFSAITYSNEYKIKMGVSKEVIDQYSVYSMEVAKEMSKSIAKLANASIGVGITGKINRVDPKNDIGEDNLIYVSIYLAKKDSYHNEVIQAIPGSRKENKQYIVEKIGKSLLRIVLNNL